MCVCVCGGGWGWDMDLLNLGSFIMYSIKVANHKVTSMLLVLYILVSVRRKRLFVKLI